MATWHQCKNPVRLWHETKYTVVTDPPHGFTTLMRFHTHEEATAFLQKAGPHSYILRPGGK